MSETERWVELSEVPSVADERWLQTNGSAPADTTQPFAGLTHTEALALEMAPERYLIEDLIPIGAVGTIAGLPETHKSFIAQAAAVRIAAGGGEILGRQVHTKVNVGYFWQDDSTRSELERIKLFERVHASPDDLPVWWFLNLGVVLPTDLDQLRVTVTEFKLGLIVLDSFYNFAAGLDLKDADSEQLVATLKKEIADPFDCTILIVDHMPWATDVNRGRLRSYGGVFKGAATRFGIYIDAVGNKLWIEARGNNIVGFKRTLAEWDSEALEMRLIAAPPEVDDSEYEQRILDHLTAHPDQTTAQVDSIKGTTTKLKAARERLEQAGKIVRAKRTSSRGYCWNTSIHAGVTSSMTLDDLEGAKSFDHPNELVDDQTRKPSADAGLTSSFGQTNESNDLNSFGRSTSSPLRGDELDERFAETPAGEELPF